MTEREHIPWQWKKEERKERRKDENTQIYKIKVEVPVPKSYGFISVEILIAPC